tara:strand:- start:130 stop:1212 length:1083 start_codon:yes stop_codon:yes gene_type:complete
MKDLILGYEMIYDLYSTEYGYSVMDKIDTKSVFNIPMKAKKDFNSMPWLLRIKLDRNKVIEKNVTMLDIKQTYLKFYQEFLGDLKGLKKQEKNIINSIVGSCILSNFDNNDNLYVHIRFDIVDYTYDLLLEICDWIFDNFKLKGLNNINEIEVVPESRLIDFENSNKEFVESSENIIDTNGINMIDIRYIKGIDLNRTYCNEVNTILKHFGIEAARSALLKEFSQVFLEFNLNYHHLSILIDVMTNMGTFTSIDRHGINKLDTDPLSRASFEMPIEQLTRAAMFSEIDHMRSVSSRIMAGRVITGGTGLCSVLLDSDLVMNSEYIEDVDAIKRSSFNFIERNHIINDIFNRSNFGIFTPN